MIVGRFGDTSGSPYIEATVSIPSLDCRGNVSFLFDTGADATTLMPLDGMRLQIDYALLNFALTMSGVGGEANYSVVEATISFPSGDTLYSYEIDLIICERDDELIRLPSLLGRDVIDRWRVIYDKPNSILVAEDENYGSVV